jgi:hypothetical protein
MKTQIYWSSECPYSQKEVNRSSGPLITAIVLQTVVLVVNIVFNMILAAISIYFITLLIKFDKTENITTEEEDLLIDKFEKGVVGRVSLASKWIKMPLTLSTVIIIARIQSFYITLKLNKCSDAETNDLFKNLGDTLPSVFNSNLIAFIMDALIAVVLPGLLYLYESSCRKKKETVVPYDNHGVD